MLVEDGRAHFSSVESSASDRRASRINLGVLKIDTYSAKDLVDEVLEHALNGRDTRQIVTANAQFYVLAEKNQQFRDCVNQADYICADGMPIKWACDTLGKSAVPRIAGVDLIETLCQKAAVNGVRVFFLGGRPESASETARILCRRYQGLQVVGVSCPPFGFEKSAETLRPVLDHIALTRPHILFVGLGAPKQEFLIRNHIGPIHVPLAIGIGGSFEILSGLLKRAPKWIQSSGLEWAFRFCQEPGRLWKRYLIGNAQFVWFVTRWKVRQRFVGGLLIPEANDAS